MARLNDVVTTVVTFNRRDLLRKNLQCLLAQEGASCDVLVLDNGSTDGTADMVRAEFGDDPRVTYFETGGNLGGAGGFHLGLYWAATAGYRYAWIMDDDSLPSSTALRELLAAGDALGDWGFLSSAVYWTDGSLCEANRPKKDLFRKIGPDDLSGDPVPVRMGSFVSMLVPTSVVREVGLPMAEYFIWTDDYEFSGRISKLHPCYFVPASRVTHAMANNTRADLVTATEDRIGRFHLLYRNDWHCYRQHGLEGRAYLASKAAYTAADVLLHAKGSRRERLAIMAQGMREGMAFKPEPVRLAAAPDDAAQTGKRRRHLLIYTDGWACGGIESYVMGLVRGLDPAEWRVSIFSPWDSGEDYLGSELRALGVDRRTLRSGSRPTNFQRGVADLPAFQKMYDFTDVDVFYANTTTVIGLIYCQVAKRGGAKLVAAHSHNSSFGGGAALVKSMLHGLGKAALLGALDVRIACSQSAGEYLFGGLPFQVVRNGIDTNRFAFSQKARDRVRAELGIPVDAILVGNVGRLSDEKNPLFQLDVYQAVLRERPDAWCLMVGSGPLDAEVEASICARGLQDRVLRVSETPVPQDYYCALDAFLMPSKFEGLPFSLVEAQCSGLPVLATSSLSREIAITDLIAFRSLDDAPTEWAKNLLEIIQDDISHRFGYQQIVKDMGWSTNSTIAQICDIFHESEF